MLLLLVTFCFRLLVFVIILSLEQVISVPFFTVAWLLVSLENFRFWQKLFFILSVSVLFSLFYATNWWLILALFYLIWWLVDSQWLLQNVQGHLFYVSLIFSLLLGIVVEVNWHLERVLVLACSVAAWFILPKVVLLARSLFSKTKLL